MNQSQSVYLLPCNTARQHCSIPAYYCRSCDVPDSRGRDSTMKNITRIIAKWCRCSHCDFIGTRAPSKAFRATSNVHSLLPLYVFSGCITVPNSLYHYLETAGGETLYYKLLCWVHLAIAWIQNAKVSREVERLCFIYLRYSYGDSSSH